MANPWDSDPVVSSAPAAPVYGAPPEPKLPTPQTPEQRTNTVTNTQQTRQQMANTTFDNVTNLRKQFEALQPVQDFRTILPLEASAYRAGPNKAGDLDLIYAFGKIMDPNSVVREGEQVMATNVGGVSEKVKGYLDSLNGQGQLTPTQRQELVGEIRQRTHNVNLAYNQLRDQYVGIANKYGFSPAEIVGAHPAQPFLQGEGDYIKRVYGDQASAQQPTIPMGAGEFGGRTPANPFNSEQSAAFDAWIKANPNASPDQLKSFVHSIGVGDVTNADEVVKALQQTGRIQPASAAVFDKPDITDVRGGNNTPTQDQINSGVRGLADTVSLGTADKLVAAGDTLFKGGTFDQNLARQYAISDFDQANHPVPRIAGQIAGGAFLPMGDIGSLGNLALKGAGYGAAYGAGSSRSLSDVPMNALMGGVAGATTAGLIGGSGKAINALRGARAAEVPPLVDPATGELNQPMDAMRPGQRVQTMRDQGFETVTPGMAGGRSARVMEQGLNNLPGSAGIMEDANSAVSGQARRAMQNVAQQFGTSKTLNEGGAELQRGATEYINRFQQVSSKAYNAIPISDKAPANLNSTIATLQQLSGRFESNPELAGMANNPRFAAYLQAFQKGGMSWKDLKDFRSMIGDKIGEMRFGESDNTGDFRSLYAALSEDMQNTAAANGPRAVAAFNRANTLYRQGQQVIDGALTRILGPNAQGSPEKAAQAVQAMTRGGKSTGDLKTLAQIRAATIKSGAWDEIASTLVHLGGQPANSEGRAFNPQTFVQWYADMSEPARAMLFKPELRKSLDDFVATSQQLARVKGLANTSNTGATMFGGSTMLAAVASMFDPKVGATFGATLGGNYAIGKLWTSPKFVNLITGYGRAVASGNANAVKSQIGRLQKLATTNPELREGVEHLLRTLANDNAPLPGAAAASPNQGPQDQGQPQ